MPSSKKQKEELKMFEVTYEEEVPLQITLDMGATKLDKPPKQKKKKKSQIDTPLAPYRPEPNGLKTFSFSEKGHGGSGHGRDGGYRDSDDYDDFEDEQTILMTDIIDTGGPRGGRKSGGRDTAPIYRRTRLAAPIQKGGDTALHMAQSFLRNLSAILILASIAVIIWHFWRSSAPYGDVTQALETLAIPVSLAAYALVAALLVLYELIALLWTMSKPRFHDEYGSYRVDVGRGSASFILLYLCSYACFLIYDHVPEINELFRGVKGAMDVFGALHNVLFGLCAAGVVSCLIRKYSSSLQKY